MKKFAIGCAIVLVVLLVLGGIASYFVYQRFVGPIAKFATNMQQVATIEKEVKNTSSFTAPENGELTEEMVSASSRSRSTSRRSSASAWTS